MKKKVKSIYRKYMLFAFVLPIVLLFTMIFIGYSRYIILQNGKALIYKNEYYKINDTIETTFDYIYEFTRIAGSKIILLKDIEPKSVGNIFKETILMSNIIQNIFHLNIFDFTLPDGQIIASTSEGPITRKLFVDKERREWMTLAPKEPWKLHISFPDSSIMTEKVKVTKIIPVGIGITDNSNKFIGIISAGININQFVNTIKKNLSPNLDFIIISTDKKFITSNINISEKELINLQHDLDKINFNDSKLINLNYKNYRFNYAKSFKSYPFIVLFGQSNLVALQEFKDFVLPDIIQALFMGSFILLMLFLFKNKVIKPVMFLSEKAKELSQGNFDIVFPEPSNIEEEKLVEALEMVKTSFESERRMKEQLSVANTEIKEINASLEQKVEERTSELKKALAAKTEFLNNMSHEVRTPIQGIVNVSQGLVDHWTGYKDSERFFFASKVAQYSQRLISLVSNLLDLSKFGAGKMRFKLTQCDMIELIEDMIQECRDLYIADKNIEFIFNKFDSNALIKCDSDKITQVLRNLFANAIKFTPKGIITISLDKTMILSENMNGYGDGVDAYKISVSDEGIGIPVGEEDAIFDPFTQSSRTKTKAGGTGLGLAICKKIIEAHNGKIYAINNEMVDKVTKGASVVFMIPIDLKAEKLAIEEMIKDALEDDWNNINENNTDSKITTDKKVKLDTSIEQTSSHDANKIKTILLIDDEEAAHFGMSMMLGKTNYKLMTALGGVEGLRMIDQYASEIDLILLDLMMPDMYGLNVIKEIKDNKKLDSLPIILQTGSSDEDELDRAWSLGVTDIIAKPYNKDKILKTLKKFLD